MEGQPAAGRAPPRGLAIDGLLLSCQATAVLAAACCYVHLVQPPPSVAHLRAAPPAVWLRAWLPGCRFNTRLKGINGGVLLLRPCPAVQQHMIELLDSHPKLRFSYGAAEQDFFNWWVAPPAGQMQTWQQQAWVLYSLGPFQHTHLGPASHPPPVHPICTHHTLDAPVCLDRISTAATPVLPTPQPALARCRHPVFLMVPSRT